MLPPSTTALRQERAARCSPTAARRSPPWATIRRPPSVLLLRRMLPYATPFKAYLGSAIRLFQPAIMPTLVLPSRRLYRRRQSAPAAALGELERCFIKLGCPADCRGDLPHGYRLCRPPRRHACAQCRMSCFLPPAVPPDAPPRRLDAAIADGIYQLTSEQAPMSWVRVYYYDSLAALFAQTARMGTASGARDGRSCHRSV